MSDYTHEYQDKNGKHTRIVGSGSRVLLQFFDPESAYSGIAKDARVVPAEDAPAVALAILKAGGKSPQEFLRYAEEEERKALEIQDAEDVHVRAWMTDLQEAGTSLYGGPVDEIWAEVPESKRDIWRGSYQANRDHFAKVHEAEAKSSPSVLGVDSPEPDRDTSWEDSSGDVWKWDGGDFPGWKWNLTPHSWTEVQEEWPETFPWMRVVD